MIKITRKILTVSYPLSLTGRKGESGRSTSEKACQADSDPYLLYTGNNANHRTVASKCWIARGGRTISGFRHKIFSGTPGGFWKGYTKTEGLPSVTSDSGGSESLQSKVKSTMDTNTPSPDALKFFSPYSFG